MNNETAIKVLTDLKNKIQGKTLDESQYLPQLKHYVKEIFGENSDLYTFLNKRRYADGDYSGILNQDNRPKFVEINCKHIDSCIETLKAFKIDHKEFNKTKQGSNFLSQLSNEALRWFIGLAILAFGGVFSAGYWFGERSKMSFVTPTIPNKESNDTTKQKANNYKDTTHPKK